MLAISLIYIVVAIFFIATLIAFLALLFRGLSGRNENNGTLWGVFFVGLIVSIALFYIFRYVYP